PGGVSVSGIVRLASGSYFSAAGAPIDYDGDGISSSRPLGTKRNQFLGPSTKNVDLRIEKRFAMSRSATLSAVVEFFNLTNSTNPKLIDNAYVNGAPGPSFGTVKVPLSGRETQLGMRLRF